MKKVYLAGPMRGIENWNFPAFDLARDRLVAAGYEVVSPADMDRENGLDPDTLADPVLNFLREEDWRKTPIWFDLPAAIERDKAELLQCDMVALLPGWEKSEGANEEVRLASQAGISIAPADYWANNPPEEGVAPRAALLDGAKALVCGDRNNAYGPPTQDFTRTAGILSAMGYTALNGRALAPHDVAMIVAALKLSRLTWMPEKEDSWMDLAGYAGCGWECIVAQRKEKHD